MITADFSVNFSNYKSFKDLQHIKKFLPINIIIGKNNSGKSAILDVIEFVRGDGDNRTRFNEHGTLGQVPIISISKNLTEDELRPVFSDGLSGGAFGMNFWQYAVENYLNKEVTVKLSVGGNEITSINPEFSPDTKSFKDNLTARIVNPLSGYRMVRLLADRDIVPESTGGDRDIKISAKGEGATKIIHNILHYRKYDASIIEKLFVNAFNEIFSPDIKITRILTKELENGAIEVYLEEENKGLIALSSSGSGIKTVTLVLLNTIVIPLHYKLDLKEYIFLLEELENNLHVHTLRKLLIYLRKLSTESDCVFFITTHSSSVIDVFDGDDYAQIMRVYKNNSWSHIELVSEHLDKAKVIDDLGIRGSDLLQANGIIWVEGPSDRVYINKWIELVSQGELREGTHYQCLFYGGRLLSNLKADDEIIDEYISMLKVNRNIAVLIDSDKSGTTSRLNKTKTRIRTEIASIDGYCWVTAGREIENYLSMNQIKEVLGAIPADYNIYTKADTLPLPGNSKIIFARNITKDMASFENCLDLEERVDELVAKIKQWNQL